MSCVSAKWELYVAWLPIVLCRESATTMIREMSSVLLLALCLRFREDLREMAARDILNE